MTNKTVRLGFIGMGLMGLPMTLRLLQAGFSVTVWNRTREKILPALEAGAREAKSASDLGQSCDIVLLCVLDKTAVQEVVFGKSGLVHSAHQDKLLVDHSSIAPDATREMADRLQSESGMRWVDAPVSGGTKGAENGSLVIMAGGEDADIELIKPILSALSSRLTHFGKVGTGQVAKLCNQVIAGTTMATIMEAMRLASNAGLDISKLSDAFKGGMADSLPFQLFLPRIIEKPDKPIGHLVSLLKDLECALALAAETDSPLPITSTAVKIYRKALDKGCGESEPTVLYSLYGSAPEDFA